MVFGLNFWYRAPFETFVIPPSNHYAQIAVIPLQKGNVLQAWWLKPLKATKVWLSFSSKEIQCFYTSRFSTESQEIFINDTS